MARIISKLNLNKTPGLVDNASLIYARNIKLLDDLSIGRDDGIKSVNLDFQGLLDTLANQISDLENAISDNEGIVSNLREEIFNASPQGVIQNYFLDVIENNPSLMQFPMVSDFQTDIFRDNLTYYDYYSFDTGVGSESLPYPKSSDYVNSSPDLKTFLNAANLKIPVFPDYFYDYVKIGNDESNYTKKKQVEDFCYNEWRAALNIFKNDASFASFYNDNFTELKDTGDNKIREYSIGDDVWYQEYYALCSYFNWFLYTHGNTITSLIKEASNVNIEALQNKILYYLNIIQEQQVKLQGLQNLYDDLEYEIYNIVGIIPYNTLFFVFINATDIHGENPQSFILKYNEADESCEFCNVDWNWSGGTITGNVNVNLKGQTVLNIAEYKDESTLIPFKSINLDVATYDLDESVYTQTPIIPITNLILYTTYAKQIPNGTYQFFIRYRIADDIYTKWTPATNILFAGNKFSKVTVGGKVNYLDTSIDSSKSFVFKFENVNDAAVNTYKDFQIGFILNHDNEVVARSWKHFSFDAEYIYFDYDKSFIKEISIEDLLEFKYNIYNVKNVTAFKNKLYIANYKESDFNPDFIDLAKSVTVDIETISRADIAEASTFTFVHDNETYTKKINVIKNEYSGISYFDRIYPIDGDYTTATYIDDIVNAFYSDTNMKNFIESSNLSVGDECSVSDYGITMKAIVKERSSVRTSLYAYMCRCGNEDIRVDINESNPYNELRDNLLSILNFGCISTGFVVPYSNNKSTIFTIRHFVFDGTNYIEIDIDITVSFDKDRIRLYDINSENITSLIPGQGYKFFIHYVKPTGEITNGYVINNGEEVYIDFSLDFEDTNPISNHDIIYPRFNNISYPTGYNSCFITIAKTRGLTAEIFKLVRKTFDGEYIYSGNCLELDTKLISVLNNIPVTCIKRGNSIVEFDQNNYYPSYDIGNPAFIGSIGAIDVSIDSYSTLQNIRSSFINISDVNNEERLELFRCTPFIYDVHQYDSFDRMNLLGYICDVSKLTSGGTTINDYFDGHYVSGNDISPKNYSHVYGELTLNLGSPEATLNNNDANVIYTIYSNYNLKYLSLNVEITDFVKRNTVNDTGKIISFIQSLELSDMFKLESMYKDFTQKTYVPYIEESTIKFDNTVRSSNILGDESTNGAYEFAATDYYNVPTNKGKIVNLCALGNFIVVHTEDSIFAFTGNNTISTNGGENISLKETDVFDTGINEIFGSEYGFGGLKDKKHALVLPEMYVFYDEDANQIYAYSGQSQIEKISDSIEKLMKSAPIKKVRFGGDFVNSRMFVTFTFLDNRTEHTMTLSYNFKNKSFVCLHDFKFSNSFNTKTKCYFYTYSNIYVVDKDTIGYDDTLVVNELSYPNYTFEETVQQQVVSRKASIVDIMFNEHIENIKTLNALSWIISNINNFRYKGNVSAQRGFLVAEEILNRDYSGDKLRIYTDTCYTGLLDISKKSNNSSIYNADSYKYPRYNQGVWTFDYFRDIFNIDDIFGYLTDEEKIQDLTNSDKDKNYPQNVNTANNFSDNHPLVEGKYFVIRFILDPKNNFKLENVSLNLNNKLNYEQ